MLRRYAIKILACMVFNQFIGEYWPLDDENCCSLQQYSRALSPATSAAAFGFTPQKLQLNHWFGKHGITSSPLGTVMPLLMYLMLDLLEVTQHLYFYSVFPSSILTREKPAFFLSLLELTYNLQNTDQSLLTSWTEEGILKKSSPSSKFTMNRVCSCKLACAILPSLSERSSLANLKEKPPFEAPRVTLPCGNITSCFAQFSRLLLYPSCLKVFFKCVLPPARFGKSTGCKTASARSKPNTPNRWKLWQARRYRKRKSKTAFQVDLNC